MKAGCGEGAKRAQGCPRYLENWPAWDSGLRLAVGTELCWTDLDLEMGHIDVLILFGVTIGK